MKKLLAFVSALVLAASAAISACAMADPDNTVINPGTNGSPDPGTAGTAIEYTSDEYTYEITIPAKVTLSSTADVTASITASNVKIRQNEYIIVAIDDNQKFKIANGSAELDYTVKREGETSNLAAGGIAAEFAADGTYPANQNLVFGKIDENKVDFAGDYTGTLTFNISVQGMV